MHLSQREQEKLLVYVGSQLARSRQARGLKLNYSEALSILTVEIMESAREGRSVAELMSFGRHIVSEDDVMTGIADLIGEVQVEATFPDGTKLVTVHAPIAPSATRVPGEVLLADTDIVANEGREVTHLRVRNTGDRPIQIGSHFHFFEVNRAMEFDREIGFGRRLNIPAGTAVRFEPGEEREVALVLFGGSAEIHGFNRFTNGAERETAFARARDRGFLPDTAGEPS